MIKLVAFDLDNTLAKPGREIPAEVLALLGQLEAKGVRVAICSGKPTYYLCGLIRQAALDEPILIGENGGVIQFGVDLPPRAFHVLPYSEEAKASIRLLREELDKKLPHMWYQPNLTALTPFPGREEEFGVIQDCIDRCGDRLEDVDIYPQSDCYDIVPRGIHKGSGLACLGEMLGVSREETAAVGDGVNDYPMFAYAGLALGVRVAEPDRVHRNFDTAVEAVEFLLKQC